MTSRERWRPFQGFRSDRRDSVPQHNRSRESRLVADDPEVRIMYIMLSNLYETAPTAIEVTSMRCRFRMHLHRDDGSGKRPERLRTSPTASKGGAIEDPCQWRPKAGDVAERSSFRQRLELPYLTMVPGAGIEPARPLGQRILRTTIAFATAPGSGRPHLWSGLSLYPMHSAHLGRGRLVSTLSPEPPSRLGA